MIPHNKSLHKKIGAGALALLIFTTNVVLCAAAETNFWEQRRNLKPPVQMAALPLAGVPARFSSLSTGLVSTRVKNQLPPALQQQLLPILRALPESFGSIRKIVGSQQPGARVVIHIQDVHQNVEAQANIGHALQELIKQNKVGLVALEGAFSPIDFSWYRRYPHQSSVKAVADYLLTDKRISGPVHTAMTLRLGRRGDQASGQALPPFVGIDEKRHYDANVLAVQQSAPLAAAAKKNVAEIVQQLQQTKQQVLNPALKSFDAQTGAYRAGSLPWGDYVRCLAHRTPELSSKVSSYLNALQMEQSLNFEEVERQRSQLLSQLVQKLTRSDHEDLLAQSIAYRSGKLAHADFYAYLKDCCVRNGIGLYRYPAMDAYIRYVLLSESLDVEAILKETAAAEKKIYARLAATDEERRLVSQSRQLYLVGKLLDFALTKEEWGEYQRQKLENGNWRLDRGVINKFSSIQFPISIFQLPNLSPFERFYLEAEARDEAMSNNLEKAMNAAHADIAVLVTGGFHSEGILRRLQPKGFTVVSYVPKITKIEDRNGSAYLSVFTQQKTPLDKLFSGEKLFLKPLEQIAPGPTAGAIAATAVAQGFPAETIDGPDGPISSSSRRRGVGRADQASYSQVVHLESNERIGKIELFFKKLWLPDVSFAKRAMMRTVLALLLIHSETGMIPAPLTFVLIWVPVIYFSVRPLLRPRISVGNYLCLLPTFFVRNHKIALGVTIRSGEWTGQNCISQTIITTSGGAPTSPRSGMRCESCERP